MVIWVTNLNNKNKKNEISADRICIYFFRIIVVFKLLTKKELNISYVPIFVDILTKGMLPGRILNM